MVKVLPQIHAFMEQIADNTDLDANLWNNTRIYLNGFGRDISAYIGFDNAMCEDYPHLMAGAVLKVYSKAENQTGAWHANRRKQVKHQIMLELKSAEILPADWEVCKTWQEVIL